MNSSHKVVKLSNNAVIPEQFELINWSCSGKLFFKLRDSFTVQRCFDDKVDYVTCAADAMLGTKAESCRLPVEVFDECFVVVCSIVAYKSIEV